jgi:hypothetical protein
MDECIHLMERSTCAICSPARAVSGGTAATQDGPFGWISPARFDHLPECVEVAWDSSEARSPGERFSLTADEVLEASIPESLNGDASSAERTPACHRTAPSPGWDVDVAVL